MAIAGKYDFPGIKKAGAAGIKVALASTAWGAWLLKSPFSKVVDILIEPFVNWLANQGLVVLNLGAIIVTGEFDQKMFDQALDDGLKTVELGRDKISAAKGKEIDDAVIAAARKYIPFQP